ncbi:carbohydrate ABC transporter permease [Mycetocola spongiae]|uniref:carbohydrate ABC transporter permease n=1 Tax=Mycetocola spongiae TaxID=2859226 RepID=UPI001CF34715|nr:sugar ABC transporter permease [Mycetocola spongiae]UCR89741.1 sugar ABC transporter permease [Mycetocola spongiae]
MIISPPAPPKRRRPTEPARPVGRRRPGSRIGGPRSLPYLMVGPAVLILLIILGFPLVRLAMLSFEDFGPRSLFTGTADFIGFGNYLKILGDPVFWQVVLRTVVVTVCCVASMMIAGLALAHLLKRVTTWARLTLTVVLVLVWAMPMVSATLVWQWLFQPQYGVMNWILTQFRIFGDLTAHDWFSRPGEGLALIILLIVWKGLPFVVLTMYASLGQIPEELYEASSLDGAGSFRAFRDITLPMMRPILAILIVLEVIWSVNSFTPVWVLTQGGPGGQTMTLGVYSYVTAFTKNDYGTGAAIAMITVALLAVFASIYVKKLAAQGGPK